MISYIHVTYTYYRYVSNMWFTAAIGLGDARPQRGLEAAAQHGYGAPGDGEAL